MSPASNRAVPDVRDDTALAVAFAEIDARQTLMEKSVGDKIATLTSAVDTLAAETRSMSRQVGEVTLLQHQQTSQNAEIGRLAEAIAEMAREFSGWKTQHEQKNDATANEVAEARGGARATRWLIGIVGSVLMLCIAAVSFWVSRELFWIDKTFDAGKQARQDLELRLRATHEADTARLQSQLTALQSQVDQNTATRGAR